MTFKKAWKYLPDVLLIELGLMISSMGSALFYSTQTGSSAMSTFCDGLHNVLNINYGNANTLGNVGLLIVLFFLNRKYINIGTILCVFTIGPWLNLYMSWLQPLHIETYPILAKALLTALGAVLMGIGLGLYMSRDLGYGALEGIVKYSNQRFNVPVKVAKVVQDISLSLIGILMGGAWGIGTIIGIFLTGPVLQRSNDFFTKKIARTH